VELNIYFPIKLPDVSTKEKAQAYIGLDMTTLKSQKENFKQTIVPEWLKNAQASGKK